MLDPASPLAREPFLAVAELAGTAAQGRILLAAPITLAEIEARFCRPHRDARRGHVRCCERQLARATQPAARRHRACRSSRCRWRRARTRAETCRRHRTRRHRAAALDEVAPAMARPRHVPAPERRRRVARSVRQPRWRRPLSEWLAPALAAKTALGEITADELDAGVRRNCCHGRCKRRLDAEAPTHFEAPTGSRVPIDYEAEGGPKIAIRVQELFGLDRHPAIAGGKVPLADRTAVAGAPAGADDARPAGLLARQLRRCARRDARPLSETPVARRSDRRRRRRAAPSRAISRIRSKYFSTPLTVGIQIRRLIARH